ncbi:tRNA (adenine(22)-N(1))-methyltransferase [Alkalicoccobacillus porphyridii]|uniref:tRNA (Adenine(22)-N(1))-methyltransferase TrmK n=1 Tax=Alkalicoccobacillus porphyridii TaxID=2597270 RepID=A0A553ZZ80_9BACI|nr:tRNA (adenine(22)-N(1))-methyltransferase TrmK [Alkalicoccobacillus porphyridii]TSB46744.1 tRNA (adenine(22)-N(1))-methyltransferase TrmK [Alkalicoccobacillus porphyridii]
MNEQQLSKRLACVAAHVSDLNMVADIGSDHAYLPSFLCLENPQVKAIAGEINEGPFQAAKSQVSQLGLTDRIDVRKGSGLDIMAPGEAEAVTIAGMGGGLIAAILEDGKEKLPGVTRLVLQPNNAARAVREWLLENQWMLLKEDIIDENNKIYEVLIAEPGLDQHRYQKDTEKKLLLGPHLMLEQNEAFIHKWTEEVENWKRVLVALEQGKEQEALQARKGMLIKKIEMVQEVLCNDTNNRPGCN